MPSFQWISMAASNRPDGIIRAPSAFPRRLVFVFGLFFVFLVYSLGWTGTFHFDDYANLAGLEQVQNTRDWLTWVISGTAGPTGRPLSLATFVLDGRHWPDNAMPILVNNTIIHVLNGLLLALVFKHIFAASFPGERLPEYVPVAATLLWLSLPILVSATLIPIQRMTLVAASFMLLGFYFYLVGRKHLDARPRFGFTLISMGVVLGTLFGVLSKEHAAALPLLILITERTLLSSSRPASALFIVSIHVLLLFPSLLLFAYLGTRALTSGFDFRDFTLAERLSTQSVILWDYLRLGFFPRSSEFSPFHDHHPVYGFPLQDWTTTLAALAWMATSILAFAWRKRFPLFAFALAWYLAAHIIESTVIPLELYFEHRNYVPLMGPVFALVVGTWRLITGSKHGLWVGGGSIFYGIVIISVLAQTTSLWGRPALAAEVWYSGNERSLRATQNLARTYVANGDPHAALRLMDRAAEYHKESAQPVLQGLLIICAIGEDSDLSARRARALERAATGVVDASSAKSLSGLLDYSSSHACAEEAYLDFVEQMATLMLETARLRGGQAVRAQIYAVLGAIYIEQRDLERAMWAIERSIELLPSIDLWTMGISLLNDAWLYEEGVAFSLRHTPQHNKNVLSKLIGEQRIKMKVERIRQQQEGILRGILRDTHLP